MPDAVIVDAVRSPMGKGKPGGALSGVHAVDLLAQTLTALVDRTGIDPGTVEDFMVGCVTPGRRAVRYAGPPGLARRGLPDPRAVGDDRAQVRLGPAGARVRRRRASVAGAYDVVVAGGIESMSRVADGRQPPRPGPAGPDRARALPRPGPPGRLGRAGRGQVGALAPAAGRVRRALARARRRRVRLRRVRRARSPRSPRPTASSSVDESIRRGTTAEKLGGLNAVFGTDANRAKLPQIDWKVTAGNASQITDGAGAMLVMSAERAAALGLRPRARIVASAVRRRRPGADADRPDPGHRQGARARRA